MMINRGIVKRWAVSDERRLDIKPQGLVLLLACLHIMACHSTLPRCLSQAETPLNHEPKSTFPPVSCSVGHSETVPQKSAGQSSCAEGLPKVILFAGNQSPCLSHLVFRNNIKQVSLGEGNFRRNFFPSYCVINSLSKWPMLGF